MSIRLFIIDDHAIVIDGIKALLKEEKEIEVVGGAEDGEEALRLIPALKPDVVLTDIQMPGADGVHVVRRVRDTPTLEQTPILVTTAFGTGTATFALQLGANAYEPKPLNPQSFLATVERLLKSQNTKKAA